MKNYEEMAAEAIRRRDIYLQQRCGRIKKAALILTVLLLFTVVGTASVMIGLNTKDAPKKPPRYFPREDMNIATLSTFPTRMTDAWHLPLSTP